MKVMSEQASLDGHFMPSLTFFLFFGVINGQIIPFFNEK